MNEVPDPNSAAAVWEYLRDEPVPTALAGMSEGVLAGLEAGRARRALRRGAAAACLVAGLIGVWAGASGEPARAPEPAGLLAVPGSAPSQLLAA